MSSNQPIIIVGMLIVGVLALAGLVRPFLGLLVFLLLHFVQPAELIPALGPFRIELIYGAALGAVLVLKRASDSKPLLSEAVFRAALVLVGAAALSVPFAVWRGGALSQTADLAKLVCVIPFVGIAIDTDRKLRRLLWFMAGLLAWFAGSGLVAYLHGDYYLLKGGDRPEDLARAQGVNSLAGGPNEIAGLIVALLPFLVALFRCTRNAAARMLLVACATLSLVTASLTGSRTGMLALVVLGLYYVSRSKRKVLALAVFLGLAWAGWQTMPLRYQERYLSVKEYAEGGKLDASSQLRLRVWQAGLKMFLDHPLLGVGAGQYPTAYGVTYSDRKHGAWMNPHNLVIQVGTELGVVGLVVFGYFLVQITKANRLVLRLGSQTGFELNYELAFACSAMLLGVIGLSCFGHTLYRPYWYLLGGLVAANLAVTRAGLELAAEDTSGAAETEGSKEELSAALAGLFVQGRR